MESRNPTKGRSTSPRKFKPRYGTSRRSTIKKSLSQEQVNFTKPIPDDPVVGIIGGGMSGLTCALYLEKRGIRSTVFDTVGYSFPPFFAFLNLFHIALF